MVAANCRVAMVAIGHHPPLSAVSGALRTLTNYKKTDIPAFTRWSAGVVAIGHGHLATMATFRRPPHRPGRAEFAPAGIHPTQRRTR